MLDILRLRVLAAIAAHGSVTKAAKHLNYSQPTVSHHLAKLEGETGARLVQRVGRGSRLTPGGRARRRVDTAAAELSAMVGLRTGRVRHAGFQSALAALVPHADGGLGVLLDDLDPQRCLVRLREKGKTLRWQPVSPSLATCLVEHATARGAVLPTDPLLRYRDARPLTSPLLRQPLAPPRPATPVGGRPERVHSLVAPHHPHLGRTPLRTTITCWRGCTYAIHLTESGMRCLSGLAITAVWPLDSYQPRAGSQPPRPTHPRRRRSWIRSLAAFRHGPGGPPQNLRATSRTAGHPHRV